MDGRLRASPTGRTEACLQPIAGSAHASTLCLLPDGTLLLAYFTGGEEGGESVAIALARLPPGGGKWGAPAVVSRQQHRSNQNPVLVYDEPSGLLTLLHASQASAPPRRPNPLKPGTRPGMGVRASQASRCRSTAAL